MPTSIGQALSRAAIFALVISSQPALALDATEEKIEAKTDAYELTAVYPQFGKTVIDAEIEDFAKGELEGFKSLLSERQATDPPYSANLAYTIARNDDHVLAVLFTYDYYTGGAHPNMNRFSFNYLMPEGTRIYLPELFTKEGLTKVSQLALADLRQQNASPDGEDSIIEAGAAPYSENFGTFVLGADELVVYFDTYQVIAYAAGPQEVHIPLAKLADVMRPDPRAPLPSFDCTKAKTTTEHAICNDASLARLDREVADTYALKLVWTPVEDHPTIKQAQRDWLVKRNTSCAAAANLSVCLTELYGARLAELKA